MNTTVRRVRRNSIEARTMWDRATAVTSFTLGNYFIGQGVTVSDAKAWFDRMQCIEPKITHDGESYHVHYHSNHWLEVRTAA